MKIPPTVMKNAKPLFGFARHMQFHAPEMGSYKAARLAAALVYGEIRDRFVPRWKKGRQERVEFDEQYNVQTAERLFVSEMSAPEDAKRHAIRYEPIRAQRVLDALAELSIDFKKFTFIDIGAGKGKVLFLAASFAFRRIIGVEFDAKLARVLQENIQTYQNPERSCDSIEAVNIDAREYQLPAGPLVLFFYFPFRAPLLTQVLDHFASRLNDCVLIWVTLEDAEKAVIQARPELTFLAKGEEFSIFQGSNIKQ